MTSSVRRDKISFSRAKTRLLKAKQLLEETVHLCPAHTRFMYQTEIINVQINYLILHIDEELRELEAAISFENALSVKVKANVKYVAAKQPSIFYDPLPDK